MFAFKSITPAENFEGEEGAQDRKSSLTKRSFAIVAILALVIAAWFFLRPQPSQSAILPPPVVAVAVPLQREITEWNEFIGRFEASRSVDVRARVPGQITAIHFTDGQYVRRGAPLFTLDSRPYRALLAEAQAGVASANAALNLSRSNLARAKRLVAEDAVAKNEIDRLTAEVRAGEASLAAASAQVRTRKLDVEFSTVRAPISGRISDRRVDAGNLVSAGNGDAATLLTTIKALDPMYFTFDSSEGAYLNAKRGGLASGAQVDVRLQDEADYIWHGALDFTDNTLDERSGTIRARAVIRNPDGFLTPGVFGNMRMSTGQKVDALLIPDSAVQTDQTRKLVLLVDKEGTVSAKEVQLGPLVNGLRVVRKGLRTTDRVVIEGTQLAMPGGKVEAHVKPIAVPKVAPPVAAAPAIQADTATLSF